MANAFVLFGEIRADTTQFENNLKSVERKLTSASANLGTTEKQAKKLGDTSNVTSRSFEKLRESVSQTSSRLSESINAFNKGDISAKKLATSIASAEKSFSSINSRVKDFSARLSDAGSKNEKFFASMRNAVASGGVMADVFGNAANKLKDMALEGVKMNASFDKLARFTTTLDKNFQSPDGLKKFKTGMLELTKVIPHSADEIAKASFTIKSAFGNLTEPELIEFLRQFGLAATASNTDISTHAENVAALAKQYQITAKELPKFNSMLASSFGQALAKDSKVAEGFNQILNSAKATKQPLDAIIAAMSTLQGASNDAAGNTTLLKNALEKLSDPKYIEGFKSIGIDVFDAKGNFRDLGVIINDVAKAMEGLSDADVAKKFDFLKDQQARQGFLTLARNFQAYNEQLKSGGDTQAFQNKTNTMLNATENRWRMFWATIEIGQQKFGANMARAFDEGMSNTTTTGSLSSFFNEFGYQVSTGLYKVLETVNVAGFDAFKAGESFGNSLTNGMSEADFNAQTAKTREGIIKMWADAQKVNDSARTQWEVANKKNQLKVWESLLGDPDESVRTKAKQNVQMLTSSIARTLEEGKPQISQAANNLIQVNTVPAQNAGREMGSIFTSFINRSIEQGRGEVQQSQISLFNNPDTKTPNQSGFQIGTSLWQGLVQGMKSGQGQIQTTSAWLGQVAAGAMRSSVDSHSPSKVFAKIGADIVAGLILGIDSNSKTAVASIQKMVKEMTASANESLGQSFVEYQAMKSGEVIAIQTKQMGLDKAKDELQELIKLKFELGRPITIPPTALGISEELKNLKAFQEQTEKWADTLKDLQSDYLELSGVKQTHLEKLLEEIATSKTLGVVIDENATKIATMKARMLDWAESTKAETDAVRELTEAMRAQRDEAFAQAVSSAETRGIGFGIPTTKDSEVIESEPPKFKMWTNLFKGIQLSIRDLQKTLPELNEQLYYTFGELPLSLGEVFASAIANFDGSISDFFKNVAQGFSQLLQQIAAELIKLAIVKMVANLISSIGGGFGGGGGGIAHEAGHFPGFASGGFTGFGADNQIAGIVHKNEYVIPADEVRSMGGPQGVAQSLQGGGTTVNNFTFNLPNVKDAKSFQQSQSQIERQMLAMLERRQLKNP